MNPRDVAIAIWEEPDRKTPWCVSWREPDTKKKRARFFATEADAQRFKAQFAAALDAPPDPVPAAPTGTVGSYLTTWLESNVKRHREAATYRSYEQLVRIYIVPTLGTWSLPDVGAVKVKRFYDDLHDQGVKLGTRRHVHACLSSALSQAVFDQLISHNPCLRLGKVLRHKEEQAMDPEPNPFTAAEAVLFLDQIEAVERDWLPYFQFLHDTGCRVGEVAALKWPNVDLDHARAKIEASFSPSDGKDKAPKTHQRRWVDLSDVVVAQLRDLRKDWMQRGRPTQYVFTNRNGSPRRQDGNMRRVFARALVACKLSPDHTPHDLRDTFATTHLMLDYGRLPWVSRQLGHETERTTIEKYFRFLPSSVTKGLANQIRPTAVAGQTEAK